jgi:GntR family transcriptional regulator
VIGVTDVDFFKPQQGPLYLKVRESIVEAITNGQLHSGDRLPGESRLALQMGVSRATLREALRVMEEEGYVIRRHGIGTFVAKPSGIVVTSGIEELFGISENIRQMGLVPGSSFWQVDKIKANFLVAEKLQIQDENLITQIIRVRTANQRPVVYCEDYLAAESFPYLQEPVSSLFDFLEQRHKVSVAYAISEIIPITGDGQLTEHLGVSSSTALLLLDQVHFDKADKPVLYSRNYFRGDVFNFHVVRKRAGVR